MGTWSRPLFVTVAPGKPEDYFIDTTILSEDMIQRWQYHAFLNTVYDNDTKSYILPKRFNLTEFMNTGCDTHKFLDHMDSKTIKDWLELFQHILDINPALETAQFHFFCSDSREPYFFRLNRNDTDNKIHLPMAVGSIDNLYYFKKKSKWIINNDDEYPTEFNLKMYKKNWNKSVFNVKMLKSHNHPFF
jgi:hypothetical protein